MRSILFLVCIIVLSTRLFAQSNEMQEINLFGDNPGNLKMFLYVPDGYTDKKIPLVVALHGCSQNAKSIADQSGWNELAEKHGFAVLYPQQKISNNASLCFNWFNNKDTEPVGGETESIIQMISYVKNIVPISEDEIHAYGLSAGAAMCTSLLANYPKEFNSGAILAGGPHKSAVNAIQGVRSMVSPKDLSPEEWGRKIHKEDSIDFPRLIIVHGIIDNVVKIQNSHELIDQWSNLHAMDVKPDLIEENYSGNPSVDKITYKNNENEDVIMFYQLKDVGHALAVDPDGDIYKGGVTGPFAVDIDFYSTYYIAKDFGIIR